MVYIYLNEENLTTWFRKSTNKIFFVNSLGNVLFDMKDKDGSSLC